MVTIARRIRPRIPPRELLARHLVGSGIEVGPGQHPFGIPLPGVDVQYLDRWSAQESAELFPQLAAQGPFVEPDVVADFNTDRLASIPDASQDFVIASHILEHLAEPIGFLSEIHRVLKHGGVVLILLPDRHHTRDRDRTPTPLSHLVDEFESHTEEVSESHLVEWLQHRGKPIGTSREEQLETFERYRRRSIHVHCWDASEFLEVILWTVEHLDEQWEFVDGCLPEDQFPPGIEFGCVLRRSSVSTDPATRRQRVTSAWHTWHDARTGTELTPTEDSLVRVFRKVRRSIRTHRTHGADRGEWSRPPSRT